MQPKSLLTLVPLAAGALALASPSTAQTTLRADSIISGLSNPIWVGSPPTDDRIFVVEQTQHDIQIYDNDGTFLGVFMDLTSTGKVVGTGERGLLSFAFDPDFANNGHFYVYYTSTGSVSRIERYTVNPTNPNLGDLGSAQTIIELTQPQTNHNGGNIQFGPDGYLYFAWGDGGGAGDGPCNAQRGNTLLGKMIRIDVNGDDFPADPSRNYAIPADNPFLGDPGVLDEIVHTGLRNPWRWEFDPHTGDMYIGDVGQNAWEEVSYAPAGALGLNFGWKVMEGNACFGTSNCPVGTPTCGSALLTDPIHVYSLSGTPCAVIGGVVYRGCAIPEEYGTYFFADSCDSGGFNNIWSFQYDPVSGVTDFTNREAQLEVGSPITRVYTFGYDTNGEVLFTDQNEVFRIVADTRSFTPDSCDLSVTDGGVQGWELEAGAVHGNEFYFVGGSLSGTAGIPTGSAVIPLTFDFYTSFSLGNPNQAPLLNTFAQLDGGGNGSASFSAPAGILPASLVGTRAYHAYVTLDPFFSANFASNAAAINFTL